MEVVVFGLRFWVDEVDAERFQAGPDQMFCGIGMVNVESRLREFVSACWSVGGSGGEAHSWNRSQLGHRKKARPMFPFVALTHTRGVVGMLQTLQYPFQMLKWRRSRWALYSESERLLEVLKGCNCCVGCCCG